MCAADGRTTAADQVIGFPLDGAETAMFAKSVEAVRGLIAACKAIEPSLISA